MNKKVKNIIYIFFVVCVLLGIIGLTYGYFDLIIDGAGKNNVVTAGSLKIKYIDGDAVSFNNVFPGDSVTKEITVENIGTLDTTYTLMLNITSNEIINDELKINYSCEKFDSSGKSVGTCENVDDIDIPAYEGSLVVNSNISIESNYVHKYLVKIELIDTGENQNYNKNKNFFGKIGVKEYSEIDSVRVTNASVSSTGSATSTGYTLSLNTKNISSSLINSVTYVIYSKLSSESLYQKVGIVSSSNKTSNFSASYSKSMSIDVSSVLEYKVESYNSSTGQKLGTYEFSLGPFCFVAGTKVKTENGYKNIEDIKVGEYVYSYNLDSNNLELKKVINVISSKTIDTYTITIKDKTVEMSPRHQVYIVDKGWTRAYDLEIGDKMLSSNGETIDITNIVYKKYDKEINTYNLTVEGNSNYFVSEIQVLVHNKPSW